MKVMQGLAMKRRAWSTCRSPARGAIRPLLNPLEYVVPVLLRSNMNCGAGTGSIEYVVPVRVRSSEVRGLGLRGVRNNMR